MLSRCRRSHRSTSEPSGATGPDSARTTAASASVAARSSSSSGSVHRCKILPWSSPSPWIRTSTDSPSGAPPHTMDDGITPRTVKDARPAPNASAARPRISRPVSGPRAPEASTNDASAVTRRVSVSLVPVATKQRRSSGWTLYPSAATGPDRTPAPAGSAPSGGRHPLQGDPIGGIGRRVTVVGRAREDVLERLLDPREAGAHLLVVPAERLVAGEPDHPAGVRNVVGGVEDVARRQARGILGAGELVVRSARDRVARERRDRLLAEDATGRA